MLRKIIRTAAVFLLTGLLAVTAVTTYVTVPDETAADEETQAEETGTTESVTASFLAGRQDVYVTVLGDSIAKGYSATKVSPLNRTAVLRCGRWLQRKNFSMRLQTTPETDSIRRG